MYSKEIFERVTRALNEQNIEFEPDYERGSIIIRHQRVDTMCRTVTIFIAIRSADYIVHGIIEDFAVNDQYICGFVELLMRMNRGFCYPKFGFDYTNNTPVCEYYFPVYNGLPNTQTVYASILAVYDQLERFGKAIISVSMGFQDPKSAFEEAVNLLESEQ